MTSIARSAACAGLVGVSIVSSGASAREAELRIRGGLFYDDNLFRVPSGVETELDGERGRSDLVVQAEVGGRLQADVSLQRFILDGSVIRNEYLKFDGLSFTGFDGRAVWQWQLSSRIKGDAGIEALRRQTSFAEFRSLGHNIVTAYQPFFEARTALRLSLFGYAGYRRISASNSAEVLEPADYSSDVVTAGLGYLLRDEGEIRLGYRRTGTDFDTRQLIVLDGGLVPLRNDYTQHEAEVSLAYPVGPRTALNGRVAYTERKHKARPERDFSGITGNVTLAYELTPLVKLVASARRQLAGVDDILTNFAVTTGIAGSVEYRPLEHILIRLDADRARRTFNGFSTVAPVEGRRDQNWVAGIALEYLWPLGSRAQLSFRHHARDSTIERLDYKANVVAASISFLF